MGKGSVFSVPSYSVLFLTLSLETADVLQNTFSTPSSDLTFPFPFSVSFCTFLAHEYPDQVHKVVMINGGGPTALEPSLCSVFNLPTCVLHWLAPCLSWSFLM